ncbi:MAG: hypothetical protein FGM27_06925 [Candidatus Omnitrophica bacterium]|nr:hypothetical protein [Candidatus Omnitrophota bacterium]
MVLSKKNYAAVLGWAYIILGALNLTGGLGFERVIVGIGILRRKKWARWAAIGLGWMRLVLIIGFGFALSYLKSYLDDLALEFNGVFLFVRVPLWVGLSAEFVTSLILLVFTYSPSVKKELVR